MIGQAPPKLKGKMARMVATKAALSIRVDALTDADDKSEPTAPSIGIENRAKLEARLRALESGNDAAGIRSVQNGKKQARFQMSGDVKTYNTAADDLIPTQREPAERAIQAVLDAKAEKKKAKEERKAKKAKKEADSDDENAMEVDGEEKSKKEKKRKRRESEVNGEAAVKEETEEERKARKKARKAEKAAAEADGESSKKKKKKSEA